MEANPNERKRSSAIELMMGDYPNVYMSFFALLHDRDKKPLKPKSFSNRYPNNTVFGLPMKDVTEEEKLKIDKLDKLSIEAGNLIDEDPVNVNSLLEIAAKAMDVCNRADLALQLREGVRI